MIYLDSSYLVRLYVRQPGSDEVAAWLMGQGDWVCCVHGRLEIASALKRQQREGFLDARGLRSVLRTMEADEESALLRWLPITTVLIEKTCAEVVAMTPTVFLRAADALHLACAADVGLKEIYSHDCHLLAAAPHFGLKGIDVITSP